MRPTRVRAKFGGFHIAAHGYTQNPPSFILPHTDTPKTHPVLGLNLRRRTFRGVCNTPLHGYMQNLASFRPKPSPQDISGRMLLRPTRVRAKFGGFHIAAHGYTQNPPSFILPHTDTPKTHPVLGLNLRRRTFRGVCNTPLHGYMQNLASFRPKPSPQDISGRMLLRPYTGACKTRPVSYSRTRIPQKRTRFYHPK